MSEEPHHAAVPTRPDFVRQRRFLVTVSLIAIVYEFLGLQITKLNLLGNEAVLDAPDRVPVVLMAVLAWAFYRYWTHAYELRPWEAYRNALRAKREVFIRPSNPAAILEGPGLQMLIDQNREAYDAARVRDNVPAEGRPKNAVWRSVSAYSREVASNGFIIWLAYPNGGGGPSSVTIEVPVPSLRYRWASFRALANTLINRSFVSEYLIPLLLALAGAFALSPLSGAFAHTAQ